jgi:hypothetical protein
MHHNFLEFKNEKGWSNSMKLKALWSRDGQLFRMKPAIMHHKMGSDERPPATELVTSPSGTTARSRKTARITEHSSATGHPS